MDVEYVQPLEEDTSEASDEDPEDHDLQSLLSNKSIPKKQRQLMWRQLLQRKLIKNNKRKVPSKSKVPTKIKSDSEDEKPEEPV